jgi:hypothetical protein
MNWKRHGIAAIWLVVISVYFIGPVQAAQSGILDGGISVLTDRSDHLPRYSGYFAVSLFSPQSIAQAQADALKRKIDQAEDLLEDAD